MTPPPRRTALVTGASSGIGAAFADVFAEHGFDLVLTARRAERLHERAAAIGAQWPVTVHVVPADLSDPVTPRVLCDHLAERRIRVDALVNGAGYGIAGRYLAEPWERHAAMLQVMVTSPAELTHRLLPTMLQQGYGRIIHVASLAGLVPASAGHTLYGAAKALVIKFSEALAWEVHEEDVHVTALCPGFTRTEFHDVTGTRVIVRQLPDWMWMEADTVARQGYAAVMRGDRIYVPGRVNRTIVLAARYLPQWLLVGIVKREARRYRKT